MSARIDLNTELWLVVNPTSESEHADICTRTTLGDVISLARDGLDPAHCPTLHTDAQQAADDASTRLVAHRASTWLKGVRGLTGDETVHVEVRDADGNVIHEGDV